MQRRQFIQRAIGALATGTMSGYAPSQGKDRSVSSSDAVSQFHKSRQFVALPCGRIAFVERGIGEAAIFLHGFPLNGLQWRASIERLGQVRRCVAPDFMGLGYSEVSDGQSVAPDAQVTMLAALLDRLSISDADLVANDSGGAIAQLFLARHPERVRSLLLTNCDTEPDSPPAALAPVIAMAKQGRLADDQFVPWLADKALARSAEGLGGLAFTYPERLADETIDCYLAPLVASPRRRAQVNDYAAGLAPNPLAGIEAALRYCAVPTRVVWGTGDTIFSSASPGYLQRILPRCFGVRKIQGAKLFFPEEFPDVIISEARRLWAGS